MTVRRCRSDCECISGLVETEYSSNFQKMDESCHRINWLSETLCKEKLQLLGSWYGSDNDGEIKRGERWSEGKMGSGSEIKIWKRPWSELNVSLRLDCGYQGKTVSDLQQKRS